jgi:hypothetical protein
MAKNVLLGKNKYFLFKNKYLLGKNLYLLGKTKYLLGILLQLHLLGSENGEKVSSFGLIKIKKA